MKQQIALIRIRGAVQGVGFRPCVWQLAQEMALSGDVRNDGDGVLIRLYPADAAAAFCDHLARRLPPLARVDSCHRWRRPCTSPPVAFAIRASGSGPIRTQVLPDVATCPACRAELCDPADRRYHYPFGNCTHCGPRYSIIARLPYDRAHTAMAAFPLCPDCLQEYRNPADRRFHAQPTACPRCGPRLWLAAPDGDTLAEEEAIERAAQLLQAGAILAIKATGGFHLACDATDAAAISRLRRVKQRPHKPLAIMLRDTQQLAEYADATDAEAELLQSPAAPIVLVTVHCRNWLTPLAPGLDRLGVMLPNTPLQHLLMAAAGRPLVMTSGNPAGEPPCLTNDQALVQLGPVVDGLLLHNRAIHHRVDDSLAQMVQGTPQLLRRARGYAPAPLALPKGMAQAGGVMALGGDSKCAPCLLHQGQAVLAPHLGDLDNLSVQRQLRQTLDELATLLGSSPEAVCCDPHPGYHSRRLAQEMGLAVIEVHHHHAHFAACLCEHRYPLDGPPVLGLILDGSGAAPAESGHPIWGGELLYGDYRQVRRLDGLPALPLPGGEQAVRQPWRNLLAQLDRFAPDWETLPLATLEALRIRPIAPLRGLVRSSLNAPLASSCGRLFDAIAALIGVAPEEQTFEGQAAMALEALAARAGPERPPLPAVDGRAPLDLAAIWQALLIHAQTLPSATCAAWFHRALAALLSGRLQHLGAELGCRTVALGGGCLQNRLLQRALVGDLTQAGFTVLVPARVPANDGGLALGQAVVGWLHTQEHADA